MKRQFDWQAADKAIRDAIAWAFVAQRHMQRRKRVNAANDLVIVSCEVQKALAALTSRLPDSPPSEQPEKGE